MVQVKAISLDSTKVLINLETNRFYSFMANIPLEVQKRAIFEQEFRTVIETRNVLAPVATRLIATAKNIYSPFTSVTAAKTYSSPCVVPVATLTVGKDELILDRYIGNAVTDCEEELSWAAFDAVAHIRGDLYASVMKKLNQEVVAEIADDATSASVDLSTADKVRNFLIGVAADNAAGSVGLRSRVDGARVVRAEKHGKPFVAAGRDAYVTIVSAIQSVLSNSTPGYGLAYGDIVETPYGVTVINLGDAAEDSKQVIFGTAGAPTIAYREDRIEVDMGQMTSETTYSGYTDIELEDGDPILRKTWYAYAKTLGRAGVFSNVQSLVHEDPQADLPS